MHALFWIPTCLVSFINTCILRVYQFLRQSARDTAGVCQSVVFTDTGWSILCVISLVMSYMSPNYGRKVFTNRTRGFITWKRCMPRIDLLTMNQINVRN